MNTTSLNVGLNVLATGLVAVGVQHIGTNLLAGAVEILLGIAVYVAYEFTPVKA